MNKGSFNKILKGNATHRIPKIGALALTTCVLVAMVNIDASASYKQANATSARSSVVLTLESESSNSQFSGLIRKWHPKSPTGTTTTTLTATTTTTSPAGGGGGGGGGAPTTTTTDAPPTTTTTADAPPTTTTTTQSTPATAGGLITAGSSRSECLEPYFIDTGLAALQAAVTSFDSLTSSTVTCVLAYLNGVSTWADWVNPWITNSGYGYTSWVAEDPQVRQLVLQVDLIPDSLENTNDPLSWEQSCASGNFDSYATQLGTNLVAAGLGDSVIRLGAEMNGTWEADFIGTTTQEQNLWATCFANEVTALRQVAGESFLIDWNPNAAVENIPYANFYPGNAYVDILGLDQYDASSQSNSGVTFAQLASEPAGMDNFEAFAAAHGKPMSFPEWGLYASPAGDDAQFIDGMGSTVENGNFAFEAYYDVGNDGTLQLGSDAPLSTAAFAKWF